MIGKLQIGAGFGMAIVDQLAADKINADLSVIHTQTGISGAIYYHVSDSVVFGLDYFHFKASWYGAPIRGHEQPADRKQARRRAPEPELRERGRDLPLVSRGPRSTCEKITQGLFSASRRVTPTTGCAASDDANVWGRSKWPRKLLIVDGSEADRTSLAAATRRRRLELDDAPDGIEAFEKLLALSYDLVVTEAKLDRLDGPDLIAKLRAHGVKTPVLVLSVGDQGGDARGADEAGDRRLRAQSRGARGDPPEDPGGAAGGRPRARRARSHEGAGGRGRGERRRGADRRLERGGASAPARALSGVAADRRLQDLQRRARACAARRLSVDPARCRRVGA